MEKETGTLLRQKLERTLEQLAPDRMIDVSNILTGNYRTITQPKTERSSKKWIPGLNIVSDNYEAYAYVVELLDKQEYAYRFRGAFGEGHQQRSPVRSRSSSPTKRSRSPSPIPLSAYSSPPSPIRQQSSLRNRKMPISAQTRVMNMLAKVQPGQMLDVSTINTDGTGTRIVKIGQDYRGHKKGIEGLDIISNNYESYKYAADILDKHQYANEFYRLYGEFTVPQPKFPVIGTTSISPSPSRKKY